MSRRTERARSSASRHGSSPPSRRCARPAGPAAAVRPPRPPGWPISSAVVGPVHLAQVGEGRGGDRGPGTAGRPRSPGASPGRRRAGSSAPEKMFWMAIRPHESPIRRWSRRPASRRNRSSANLVIVARTALSQEEDERGPDRPAGRSRRTAAATTAPTTSAEKNSNGTGPKASKKRLAWKSIGRARSTATRPFADVAAHDPLVIPGHDRVEQERRPGCRPSSPAR